MHNYNILFSSCVERRGSARCLEPLWPCSTTSDLGEQLLWLCTGSTNRQTAPIISQILLSIIWPLFLWFIHIADILSVVISCCVWAHCSFMDRYTVHNACRGLYIIILYSFEVYRKTNYIHYLICTSEQLHVYRVCCCVFTVKRFDEISYAGGICMYVPLYHLAWAYASLHNK